MEPQSQTSLPPTFVQGFHDESIVKKIAYTRLGKTNMMVSKMSFGCYQLGIVEIGSEEEKEAIDVVIQAVKSGLNYIDTSPWYGYGSSEVVLGKALKKLPRESYYVATKVGRYNPEYKEMFDFSYDRTLESVEISLKKLGVDYVDVIKVHDLEFAPSLDIILEQTLPALQKVVDEGKARYIGITGYPVEKLKEVIIRSKFQIDIVLSYARCNLFDRTLKDYLPFFQERNIGVVNAAFLGMGLLTSSDPPIWHPAGQDIKLLCKKASEYCQSQDVDISKLATLYAFKLSGTPTNLVGFNSKSLLEKNLDALIGGLNEKEEQVLQELIDKYFVSNNHWEGVEVARYLQKISAS